MRYPRQDKTIERLENQARIALKTLRDEGRRQIHDLWEKAKFVMRSELREIYKQDFGRSTWNISLAARRGTLKKMDDMVGHVMRSFHQESMRLANKNFRQLYQDTVLRNAYILDTVTPETYQVKLPKSRLFTEAALTTYAGPDADTAWKVRWSAWLDTYRTAINSNIRLGAHNDSSIADVENEVDVTRAGTPAFEVGDALDRIFISQAVSLQAQAQEALAAVNDEMQIVEIWQTSYSQRVCDTCDEYAGLTKDEVDDEIPAHPNCECYWRLVPADWADLLASGDEDDRDLAKWMDANGITPSTMLIRNEDGEPAGKMIVSFENWLAGMAQTIGAR